MKFSLKYSINGKKISRGNNFEKHRKVIGAPYFFLYFFYVLKFLQ